MDADYKIDDRKVKTTILLEKSLLDEIDRLNPFNTRKDFLNQACKAYLKQLKRRSIDEALAKACAESAAEDLTISEEWEPAALENWK
jgi:metal-responsive CopG/Arc/MetJ family transcriptional regulator